MIDYKMTELAKLIGETATLFEKNKQTITDSSTLKFINTNLSLLNVMVFDILKNMKGESDDGQ